MSASPAVIGRVIRDQARAEEIAVDVFANGGAIRRLTVKVRKVGYTEPLFARLWTNCGGTRDEIASNTCSAHFGKALRHPRISIA